MFRIKSFTLAVLILVPLASLHAADIVNLRCEYRADPLGIDALTPRLGWVITSDRRGEMQTAFQVLVASKPELLAKDEGDLWDSGKVTSEQSNQVAYQGKSLVSRQRCFWKVRIWDKARKASGWSKPAFWSMGLLKPDDWQAKWIGLDQAQSSTNTPKSRLVPAQWIWFPEGEPASSAPAGISYFRRTVSLLGNRKIVKASVEMTADNAFTLYVNDNKAGQGTDYNVPVMLDITGLLKGGSNTLAVAATNAGPGPNPAGLIAVLTVEFAEGSPLVVCTDAQWKSNQSKEEGWELAGFDDARWPSAKALGAFGMGPWGHLNQGEGALRLPARYLRREFSAEKKVARATTSVCGLGFFDLYLNGEKVSDHVMDPALSDYRKSAYYVTFDVTRYLQTGRNAMGVVLGNGRFFAPRTPAPTMDYGYPKLLVQTEIAYEDGTTARVVSDESWKLTAQGPIRANNEYDGEEYDARMEMDGWNRIGFDDAKWESAQLVQAPGGVLKSQMMEPMRVTQTIKPVAITNPKPGTFVVDMGQNFYGTVRLKVRAPRGTEVHIVSAYSLLPDGMLKTADNRGAKATDVYTFKGEGEEVWSPRFKGQGYRRVQVTGFPGTLTVDNFEGLVIHTDAEPVGDFACSNNLVNQIHRAMRWGFRMYLRSAPLDPDRDERQAWMGDPAKDAESEAFNFNVAPFYTKWMDDVRRCQRADGGIPDVSMYWAPGGADVVWPSVLTIIPDWIAEFYGDRRVAETNYSAMKEWLKAMRQLNQEADGTLKGGQYGDWCDAASMDGKWGDSGKTPQNLIVTAYHYNNCRIMARAAKRLNKPEDAKQFDDWAEQLKQAFNKKFLNPATGVYEGGTQCAFVLPLAFGMVPEEHRQKVIDNLVNDILFTHKGHLSVGLIGMQWMMQLLTNIGRPDVAWTIVTQTTRPSWGYMIGKGATTIWERWDCDTRDPGMNSEALLIQAGNLDAWFYQTLAGINYDPAQPGFKHIIIKPMPVGELTWVKAHYNSFYGRIVSNWKREDEKLTMEVTIPANTTATVFVPTSNVKALSESGKSAMKASGVKFLYMKNNAAVFSVGSGTYLFQSSLHENSNKTHMTKN